MSWNKPNMLNISSSTTVLLDYLFDGSIEKKKKKMYYDKNIIFFFKMGMFNKFTSFVFFNLQFLKELLI